MTVIALQGMSHSQSITGVDQFDSLQTEPAKNTSPVSPFQLQGFTNVTSAGNGARILFATDEWFAAADNLLKDGPPVFDPEAFCEQGKVMDGWESRRRREEGHDWCIIKLSSRAQIHGIEVDTAHFTGNQVPVISLQIADLSCESETEMVKGLPGVLDRLLHGCIQGTGSSPEEVRQAEEVCHRVEWLELLRKTPLSPGYETSRMHYFCLDERMIGTHVRLNYFPDGGVARLRIWGERLETVPRKPGPAYSPIRTGRACTVVAHSQGQANLPSRQSYPYPELSVQMNGGSAVTCSNKHYGEPLHLIQFNLGKDMGDGWETARHPNRPGILVKDPTSGLTDSHLSDWCILKLGSVAGEGVSRIILDTKHFKGNYPESVKVEGCFVDNGCFVLPKEDVEWFSLVPRGRLAPDSEHVYDADKGQIANASRPVSHVRVSIYPDGGLSRVRIYGEAGFL